MDTTILIYAYANKIIKQCYYNNNIIQQYDYMKQLYRIYNKIYNNINKYFFFGNAKI